MGEFANFLGNDRKALIGFTRTGGFYASIERQKISLEGNLVDDTNDIGDLLRALLDTAHGLFSIGDELGRLRRI